MAGTPLDRIPLHTIVLPVLGMGAWLLIGKTGLGALAVVLRVVAWQCGRRRAPRRSGGTPGG
jgi:hypothetical protein